MITETHLHTLASYHQATARLEALIEATPTPQDASREAVRERAAVRMDRLRRFLERLGNPHQGYPIVHVGGTSGKGSTSTSIASILTCAGFRTALHTSPYLQTPAEKLQLDGKLIAPDLYVALTDAVLAAHDEWVAAGEDILTYGEAWFALTALFFREVGAEIAVLEVGAGGRFDLTNIVEPAVSVITSVGIDHTHTLGNTIADIAWHKAGIVKPGIPAVTSVTNPEALAIIRHEATACVAPLTVVDPDRSAADVVTGLDGTGWTDTTTGARHHAALRGSFQARNGATALAVVDVLRGLGFHLPAPDVERGLQTARIPGRIEVIEDGCLVMLDGAHNADKAAALAADIPNLLRVPPDGKRIAVLGILEAKNALGMIQSLVPVMDVLIATSPQVTAKEAKDAAAIADLARAAGYHGPVSLEPEPRQALAQALALAGANRQNAVFVTGSLYLVGNVRDHWYREDDIVLAQSSWPT